MPAGKLLKTIAAVIVLAVIAAGSAAVVSGYLAKPALDISPGTALSGNPVRVTVIFPFGSTAGEFSGLSLNYGDGNSTTLVSSQHTYQKPGVYTITLTYSRNGETGKVTSGVRILPSYYELPAMRYGNSASYAITNGSMKAENPYGIFSGNYTYSGLNLSITVDSINLHLNGTVDISTGNTSVNSTDGMGFTHNSYEIRQTVFLNGSGFAIGFAAGTALNISMSMKARLLIRTFNSAENNAAVSQTVDGSISLSADYEGLSVPMIDNLNLTSLAYGYIGNGTLSQIMELSALSRSGIFQLTGQALTKYVSHVPSVLETGLYGSYGGYGWNATALIPSLNDPMLNLTITGNGSLKRTLTMDELSPYPLVSATSYSFGLNGTNVEFFLGMKRTAFEGGSGYISSAESGIMENAGANYTLWKAGSRVPDVSGGLLRLNLTTAYSLAVNGTGLGSFIVANPDAVFINGTYNFTHASWYFVMGNLSDGAGYAVLVADSNGTVTASGRNTTVSAAQRTAQGDGIISLDSAIALLNDSSVRNYFFNGNMPNISRLSYSPSSFLPQLSPFLPPASQGVPLSVSFYAGNGTVASFDCLNGEMMFFLES